MPRPTRIYAPGVAFHVVSVTQGGHEWLVDDVAHLMCEDIDAAAAASGHRVMARVIMRDHLHIIVKQAATPLGWFMQRILQRAAARVRQKNVVKGHVFARRYWAEPIPTPAYLRRAIVYTHLNPCKAEICAEPHEYTYSSHSRYLQLRERHAHDNTGYLEGLMAFADDSLNRDDVVANYLAFIDHCQLRRRLGIPGDWLLPGSVWFDEAPTARLGDEHWLKTFTHFAAQTAHLPRRTIDVSSVAVRLLHRIDADLTLDMVRFGARLPRMRDPITQLVCGLLTAGAAPAQIARCLGLSPSLVSRINTQMRFSVIQQ